MNFVRGVADFLRKGSLVQGAGGGGLKTSDLEVQIENSSLPPQSWPELQFSKHGDEENLDSLWKGYQEASSQDETQKALEAFLVKFNEYFKNWRTTDSHNAVTLDSLSTGVIQPLVDHEKHEGSDIVDASAEKTVNFEGCVYGHPTRVVVGLVQELKALAKTITEMHFSSEKDPFLMPQALEIGILLLDALAIVTRSSHNRIIFSFFGGLQILMALMKATVVNLKTVATVITSDLEPISSSAVCLSFLHNVLVNIVSITSNFIAAEVSSLETSFSLTDSQPSQISDPDAVDISETFDLELASSSRSSRIGIGKSMQRRSFPKGNWAGNVPSSSPLFETGGLNWFVELLRILRRLCLKGAIGDLILEQLTLRTLEKAIKLDTRTQNHFRSIGGLDVLLEGLGNPLKAGLDKVPAINFGKSRCRVDMCEILDTQILSFEVLRAAVFRNTASLQYVRDSGGLKKLSETIQWAAFSLPKFRSGEFNSLGSVLDVAPTGMFSYTINMPNVLEPTERRKSWLDGLDGKERLSDYMNINGLNFQVDRLCKTLCSFLFPTDSIPYIGALPVGNDAIGVSGSYWEVATRSILDVLLLVFRSHESSEKSVENPKKPRVTTSSLQHYFLDIFKKLLAMSPTTLRLFREEGVWALMFSEYFFYFKFVSDKVSSQADPGETLGCMPNLELQIESRKSFTSVVALDAEPLQLEVISFLELAATINGCTDNLLECSSLIQALEQCQQDPAIVTMLVKSLHRILQLAAEPTVSAFHTLDMLSVFSNLVVLEMEISTTVIGEVVQHCLIKQKDYASPPREHSRQAKAALFALFDDYLSVSEQAQVDALHNLRLLDILLGLLRDESSRDFALRHVLNLMKLPGNVDGKHDDQLRLCTKYLETLSEVHSEKHDGGVNTIMKMLSGIQDVLQSDCKYYQALFQEGECFVHIVSLLNKVHSEEVGADLSLEVLLTLRHLLSGNEISKLAFRELVGPDYRTLEMMLRNNHYGHPSRALLFSVLDMIMECDFDVHLSMVIENEDAVILFFKLLQQCTGSLLFDGLDTFHKLLEDSTANQASCAKSGLLSLLLDWFFEAQDPGLVVKLADLIRLLGSHSICGTEMRKIFFLLCNIKNGSKLESGKLLLNTFKRMLTNEGPAVFFELNGRNSGIVVTTPLRFPNRGFTFTCWARVEGFSSDYRIRGSAKMSLFSFLTQSGKGYMTSIGEDELVFESITHKRQCATVGIKLKPKQWHFLCIAHASGHSLSSASDLSVFVDGYLAGSEKLRYPKLSELLTRCTIAASSPHPESGGKDIQYFSGKYTAPFCGQLGPLYFFNEALSPDQVYHIYLLGPGYMYSFLSNEVGCNLESNAVKSVMDPKDGLASKVIFGYNAQASTGRCLYDVSPALEHMAVEESHEATILEGTKLCYRHLVQDSINCVGGVTVFFPLITHSEQLGWQNFHHFYEVDAADEAERHQEDHLQLRTSLDTFDDNIAVSVVEVIRAILAGKFSNQQFMHYTSGLSILGYLLKSLPPGQLTLSMVSALDALLNTFALASAEDDDDDDIVGLNLSKALVAETISEIYLNMHIWIHASYVVQREILVSLLNYSQKNSPEVRAVCGFSRILDMIHQFYWEKPISHKASTSRTLWDQVKRTSTRDRLTQQEVAHLRSLVLAIAKEVLRDGITLSELKALIFYLEASEDDVCVEDVLQALLELLAFVPFVTTFSDNIRNLGGCQIFLGLLTRQSDAISLLGLRLFSVLLTSMPAEKKVTRIFNLSGTGSRLSLEQQQAEKLKLASLWDALSEKVLMLRFTVTLCSTLFDILLGGAIFPEVHGGISLEVAHDGEVHGFKSLTSTQITVPQMLGIILKFFLTCDGSVMRTSVLKCIHQLLEKNPRNSEVLVQESAWQDWFFAVMVSGLKRKKQCLNEGAAETLRLLDMEKLYIRKILAIIHMHCVCNLKGGWQHLERTVNFVHMYSDQGMLSRFDLLCNILSDLIEEIIRTCPGQAALTAQPCRDNILYAISLIDELSVKDTFEFLPFPGDAFTEESVDGNFLSGGYVDLGFATILKSESRRGSREESEILSGVGYNGRRLSSIIQAKASETCKEENAESEGTCWHLYDSLWSLLTAFYSAQSRAGTGVAPAGPTLGQRARGLVESLNVPASEMAAAVVSGGLGSVVGINLPIRLVDKAIKLRAEKCPRVVFRLVLLYLYKADLQAASHCVQQFISILPGIFSPENEAMKNRLHLFLWSLLDARAQVGSLNDGARFHIISQLIKEILEQGKGMLTLSLVEKDKAYSDIAYEETASVHGLLQQDRVLSAVKDEAKRLKASLKSRTKEVESLNKELNEASVVALQQGRILEDQAKTILKSIYSSEVVHRTAYQLAYDEEQQATANRWCHMFRNLTDERGPWSPVAFPNNSLKWWKLDKTEDPSRRRVKLKRNYHFNEDLIRPRISITAEGSENSSEFTGMEVQESTDDHVFEKAESLSMKGTSRKITDDESEPTEDEISGSVDGKSSKVIDNSSVSCQSHVEPVKNIIPKKSDDDEESTLAGHADVGEEEVVMSVSCVLVAPRRKVAGRLEIMLTSLHFYGEFVVEGSGVSSVFSSSCDLSYRDCSDEGSHEEVKYKGEREYADPQKLAAKSFEMSDKITGGCNAVESSFGHGRKFQNVKRHKRWNISQITAIHETRYLLQHTAIEIYFSCSISPVFFNFKSHKCAKKVAAKVASQRNGSNLGKVSGQRKEDSIYIVNRRKASDLAEKARECWRRRELSNFEYLMALNTLAGRSYSDLTQYPIFPWIIADYTSEELDFSKPSTYRDLSKPVGALDEKRFKVFEERYHNFTDPDIPSFYYGSHYSSMGIVLFYLLRLEPFTSLHQNLQGGKFDHADRLFHSIAGAYANCLSNTSDVKELIPEFFYMPEFLTNDNQYFFGVKQDGEKIGDVALPLWAKGSPEEFVRKNREALESEHVSGILNQWIDLIFGYKQRGRPAVEAANVFYHLTYEGAADLDALTDPRQRAAIEDQIASFGQTPMQLFRKKHPKRGPPTPASHPLYYAPASITLTSCITSTTLLHGLIPSTQSSSLLFVGLVDGKVVTVSSGLIAGVRLWLTPPLQGGGNFTFSSSQDPFFGVGPDVLSPRRIAGAVVENTELSSQCFELLQVHSSCFLLTCGHWDHSFKVVSLSDGHMVQSNLQHKDVITCISVASDGAVVVTGSRDTTVMVWDVEPSVSLFSKKGLRDEQESSDRAGKQDLILSDKPRHILCGHDDTVTSVAVRIELDLVISGSKDASCIFHTLREGRYVRSLRHPKGNTISKLAISQHGRVVLYSADDLCIRLCSVNGKWLACAETNGRLNCMKISSCGESLVHGGDQGQIFVRNMHSLDIVRRYDGTGVAITTLFVTPEDCFLVGTQDGSLLVYSIELYSRRKSGMLQSIRSRSLMPGS
ncbi:hypothetical protein O6H91_17G043300 [Diphasiastrum complanatum]|uniref:Uncharacterized protein n=2 Tax=Diphasiastrum complanatum TaxID=34168 RepID=A0ACC2B636_DIPCM|nr:hypothetical protein O6H91_17G043300 [Diphasiastrum complanatum]